MKYLEDLYSIEPENRMYDIEGEVVIVDWNYYIPMARKHKIDSCGYLINKVMWDITGQSVAGRTYRKGLIHPTTTMDVSMRYFKFEFTRYVMRHTLDNNLGREHFQEVAEYMASKIKISTEICELFIDIVKDYFNIEYDTIKKGTWTQRKTDTTRSVETWDELFLRIQENTYATPEQIIQVFREEIIRMLRMY